MNNALLKGLLALGLMALACGAMAGPDEFSFAVIAHPLTEDDALLHEAIAETDADNLAFVVANGIKARAEPCSDEVYDMRKSLLERAKNGLVVSIAASDWAECKDWDGKSAAIGRLNRLREVFFSDELSLGETRIPLVRQSVTVKFHDYSENARWEFGAAMFATINLPDNNNNYLSAAGRNGEFEDRLIANRYWLQRVFTYAKFRKLAGIVLICDGNPFSRSNPSGNRHDGFAEVRQQITALAAKFPGRVLLVYGPTGRKPGASTRIAWRNNLGLLETGSPWIKVRVDPSRRMLFAVAPQPPKPPQPPVEPIAPPATDDAENALR